jgi:hypothetical protein
LNWTGPTPPSECGQLHVVTAWGDEIDGAGQIEVNPDSFIITDSDNELLVPDDDVRIYPYDDYYSPDMPNVGEGWYFDDYSYVLLGVPVHPFIMNVTTLSEADTSLPPDCEAQKVIGSYKIRQNNLEKDATDLHYIVGTDADIYRYTLTVDWEPHGDSTVVEDSDPPQWLTVDWDLSGNPVPFNTEVVITTEFVLCIYNGICYDSVRFTYPEDGDSLSSFEWSIDTPPSAVPVTALGVCGGHVIGGFEIYDSASGDSCLGEYRFEHEYNYDQDPEYHVFELTSREGEDTIYIGDLRFGHSYGYLYEEDLWALDDTFWIERRAGILELPPGGVHADTLIWTGLLAYPDPTDVEEPSAPSALVLKQNYPNPFNPVTVIQYDLPGDCHVRLEVFDIQGRKVAAIVDEYQEAGSKTVRWNAGRELPSGVYFCRLRACGISETKKMVILR